MKEFLTTYIYLFAIGVILFSCSGNVSSDNSSPKVVKKTFTDFFKFEPGADVKDFHFYADELGSDASYWIAFECNDSTVQKIRKSLRLYDEKEGPGIFGGLNTNPKEWWDTSFVYNERSYTKNENNLYWFLWYDKNNRKVYFLTLDT